MPRRFSFPNQKRVIIHKENVSSGFLQISKENLYRAYQDLDYAGTMLYLYLAANCDGYNLALSPQAVKNSLGMPESTCREQTRKLIDRGYLIQRAEESNIFDFYEIPHERKTIYIKEKNENGYCWD